MAERYTIGREARERFGREGLLLLRGAAEPALCDALRALGEAQLRQRIPPYESEGEYLGSERREFRETLRRLRQVYDRDPLFRRWMEWPALRPLLAELLGAPPVLVTAHHNALMTKMPHTSSETRWHRDRRYWHYTDDRLLSVWLALGEEHEENGVLEFIPGSHRERFPPEAFDDREYFREAHPGNRQWIARKVRYDLRKGDVVLFHCALLHRAGPNRTQRPKLSLVYTVKAADNAPLPGTRSARFREIPLPL
jgi:phytanoyl-CoA hydroxylase